MLLDGMGHDTVFILVVQLVNALEQPTPARAALIRDLGGPMAVLDLIDTGLALLELCQMSSWALVHTEV